MEFVEGAFTIRLNNVYKIELVTRWEGLHLDSWAWLSGRCAAVLSLVCQILSGVTNIKGFHKIAQISRGCPLGTQCPSLPS